MELDINELLNFSPLMKTFTFNAWVVAGFTPITRGSTLDYYINRPQGMKGYIINLTLRGQARAKAGDGFLLCRENDLLLFPPGVPHHYGRDEHSEYWDHLWIYFIPRPYWIDWLKWDQTTHGIGKTTINDPDQLQQLRDLFYEVIRHHSASVPLSEALAMNARISQTLCGNEGLKTSTAPIGSRLLPTTYCYVPGYAISVCRRNT